MCHIMHVMHVKLIVQIYFLDGTLIAFFNFGLPDACVAVMECTICTLLLFVDAWS